MLEERQTQNNELVHDLRKAKSLLEKSGAESLS